MVSSTLRRGFLLKKSSKTSSKQRNSERRNQRETARSHNLLSLETNDEKPSSAAPVVEMLGLQLAGQNIEEEQVENPSSKSWIIEEIVDQDKERNDVDDSVSCKSEVSQPPSGGINVRCNGPPLASAKLKRAYADAICRLKRRNLRDWFQTASSFLDSHSELNKQDFLWFSVLRGSSGDKLIESLPHLRLGAAMVTKYSSRVASILNGSENAERTSAVLTILKFLLSTRSQFLSDTVVDELFSALCMNASQNWDEVSQAACIATNLISAVLVWKVMPSPSRVLKWLEAVSLFICDVANQHSRGTGRLLPNVQRTLLMNSKLSLQKLEKEFDSTPEWRNSAVEQLAGQRCTFDPQRLFGGSLETLVTLSHRSKMPETYTEFHSSSNMVQLSDLDIEVACRGICHRLHLTEQPGSLNTHFDCFAQVLVLVEPPQHWSLSLIVLSGLNTLLTNRTTSSEILGEVGTAILEARVKWIKIVYQQLESVARIERDLVVDVLVDTILIHQNDCFLRQPSAGSLEVCCGILLRADAGTDILHEAATLLFAHLKSYPSVRSMVMGSAKIVSHHFSLPHVNNLIMSGLTTSQERSFVCEALLDRVLSTSESCDPKSQFQPALMLNSLLGHFNCETSRGLLGREWRRIALLGSNERFTALLVACAKSFLESPSNQAALSLFGHVSGDEIARLSDGIVVHPAVAVVQLSVLTLEHMPSDANVFQRLGPLLLLRRLPSYYFSPSIHLGSCEWQSHLSRLGQVVCDIVHTKEDKTTAHERRLATEVAARSLPFGSVVNEVSCSSLLCTPFLDKIESISPAGESERPLLVRMAKTALYAACISLTSTVNDGHLPEYQKMATFAVSVLGGEIRGWCAPHDLNRDLETGSRQFLTVCIELALKTPTVKKQAQFVAKELFFLVCTKSSEKRTSALVETTLSDAWRESLWWPFLKVAQTCIDFRACWRNYLVPAVDWGSVERGIAACPVSMATALLFPCLLISRAVCERTLLEFAEEHELVEVWTKCYQWVVNVLTTDIEDGAASSNLHKNALKLIVAARMLVASDMEKYTDDDKAIIELFTDRAYQDDRELAQIVQQYKDFVIH